MQRVEPTHVEEVQLALLTKYRKGWSVIDNHFSQSLMSRVEPTQVYEVHVALITNNRLGWSTLDNHTSTLI
jgi:hypothetical protein